MVDGKAHAFTLGGVYPWGRTYEEYVRMFGLREEDLGGKILACADGPAGFNAELTGRGGRVVSVDPLYQFGGGEIRRRVEETYEVMMEGVRREAGRFVWRHVAGPEELGRLRMSAMETFLEDYEAGLKEGRYVIGALPNLEGFAEGSFDLAVCSHFLFLYSREFDGAFHVAAIREMLRVAREVRIFPLLDMKGERSAHVERVMKEVGGEIVRVEYEFQRGGNEMLRIDHGRRR